MRQRTLWLAATACAAVAGPALAQTPAKPPPAKPSAEKASGTVGEIVVEGAPPPVRVDAEKKSYSVSGDLQATTGSIADALRNVPSVEVDVQGNLAIRGDSNVTIMIDGKPTGMFRGDGRAQALQSLPADQIDRVEVVTNPSAAYSPEGTGGIINLVTKKTAKPGVNGSARLNLGSERRKNGGVNVSYRNGRFTYTADASARRDVFGQHYTVDREFFDASGATTANERRASVGGGIGEMQSARTGLDFDLDADTRITGGLRYQNIDFRARNFETLDRVSAGGLPLLAYDTTADNRQGRRSVEASLNGSHKFGEGHELSVAFTNERMDEDRSRVLLRNARAPAGPTFLDDNETRNRVGRTQLKVDYTRPLGDGVKLKLGYEFNGDDNDYRVVFGRSAASAPAVIDPTRSNLFRFDQQIHAVYGTYERPVGDLTVLGGLRVESTQIDLDQVTQGRRDENDYVRLYPSLHLGYRLDDTQQVSASYSRRVQRPQPTDYNAFAVYFDPQNLFRGNPDLKPQTTDSFELGYQYRKKGQTYLATAYYRRGRDAVNDVFQDIGDGVILQTRDNIGRFQAAGLELVANGRLPGKVTYNVSANLGWNEIDARPLGFGSTQRSAWSLGGRGTLSWQATDKDFLQLQGYVFGKRLLSQGVSEPQKILNLGYRHKFSDRLSGVVTAQDFLDLSGFESRVVSPTFREHSKGAPKNRTVYVGFTYTFGGGKARDQAFDFGSGND
ncbi:TonB-dependent receptor [Phenylobacterium sp.]|uniref:TonB-dependent receptor domain-containing protein n=1 Tax=Phenylobacterium sp. TaxID=1871053 RepID=UPI0025EBBDA2|nr:TonB-dependent receptor [Phenylobacterium sp.]